MYNQFIIDNAFYNQFLVNIFKTLRSWERRSEMLYHNNLKHC